MADGKKIHAIVKFCMDTAFENPYENSLEIICLSKLVWPLLLKNYVHPMPLNSIQALNQNNFGIVAIQTKYSSLNRI